MIPALATGAVTAAAAAAAAALMLPSGPASPSSIGAGVQPGPVRVTMAPGTTQRARVMVRDTGSAAETLTVLGGRETSDGPIVAFPWVRRASVTTAPGIWRTVTFTIAVPAGTPPGHYWRYAGAYASTGSLSGPGGVSFGAASFTDLVITVTPSAASRHNTPRNDHATTKATGA